MRILSHQMKDAILEKVAKSLDQFQIEIPSWGFADTGTRFGKYLQDGSAIDIYDKFADAAQVHKFTGCTPTVATHVLWDFNAKTDMNKLSSFVKENGLRFGSINPNLFEKQNYKYGSFGNMNPAVREQALQHVLDSIELGQKVGSKVVSLWFADGSNYPGEANIRTRKKFFEELLAKAHAKLAPDQLLFVEYKPFEPAFYHTDIADWGMAYVFSKKAGPQARVLVDTGHHYNSQNIEQIVAWLLDEKMLGGFHFNDRRYADDDLTISSIDPYQTFRIFHEIQTYEWEMKSIAPIDYTIDQSHIDKPKIEAMIQTAMMAQELYAKAALVDREKLSGLQSADEQVDAEELLREAFFADVRPAITEWRKSKKLAENPLHAFRKSGYLETVSKDRKARRGNQISSGGYA